MTTSCASFKLGILFMLSAWTVCSCTHKEVAEGLGDAHALSLAMSLKNVDGGSSTKMTAEITQSTGVFRGIEHMYLVPFGTEEPQVGYQDPRLGVQNVILSNPGISQSGLVPNNNAHLFGSAFVPNGMNCVLAYGKTPDQGSEAGKAGKHTYGVLTAKGLSDPSYASDISFQLEPVLDMSVTDELSEAYEKADALLDQFNVVMSIMRSSSFASLVGIFDSVKRENQILSCSYATFDYLRTEIQTALIRIPFESTDLIDEISRVSSAIDDFSSKLLEVGTTFPVSYGIPEGSIGFWWNGNAFIRRIGGVNVTLVDPATYCYPPSLWYYANSTILTSNNEDISGQYVQTNKHWDDIIVHYTDGGTVNNLTQSIAINDPLQYGVALMSLSLGDAGTTLVNGCPLTGIIVGDQKDVDFRFMPGTGPSRYIYDNVIDGALKIGSTAPYTQTLVLETAAGSPVHIALEFRNTTGYTLHCQQGDILPRCRFYMAGVLDAPSEGSVFSKDHKTSVTVRINGLDSAYTTVPDLHSPQLEIGLVAEMKWNQITPQTLVLDY